MNRFLLTSLLFACASLAGCSSSPISGPTPLDDASVSDGASAADGSLPDGATPDGATHDAGVACCAPSAVPAACMVIGGVQPPEGCSLVCDFFCSTNWTLVTDAGPCPIWTYTTRSPAPGEGPDCLVHPDAGHDAGHDAGDDAGQDAGDDAGDAGDAGGDAGADGGQDAGTD